MSSTFSELEESGGSNLRLWVGGAGCLCSICMIVGALGPWVHASAVDVSGFFGFGFPVAFAALASLGLHAFYLLSPRRPLLLGAFLCGVVGIVASIVVFLLVVSLSGFGDLLSTLLAFGAHGEAFADGDLVSVAWGIPLLGASSLLLSLISFSALFGSFNEPVVAGRIRSAGLTRLRKGRESDELAVDLDDDVGPLSDAGARYR